MIRSISKTIVAVVVAIALFVGLNPGHAYAYTAGEGAKLSGCKVTATTGTCTLTYSDGAYTINWKAVSTGSAAFRDGPVTMTSKPGLFSYGKLTIDGKPSFYTWGSWL